MAQSDVQTDKLDRAKAALTDAWNTNNTHARAFEALAGEARQAYRGSAANTYHTAMENWTNNFAVIQKGLEAVLDMMGVNSTQFQQQDDENTQAGHTLANAVLNAV